MRIVEVTWHAVEQFRDRFPFESGSASSIRLLIAQEVQQGLDAGRYASKQPSWARTDGTRSHGRRNGAERDRSMRYVWTDDRHRMYLVDKHGYAIRVVTSIRPDGTAIG